MRNNSTRGNNKLFKNKFNKILLKLKIKLKL